MKVVPYRRSVMADEKKKTYEKPSIESERIFEHTALACGSIWPTDSKDIGHLSGDCADHAVS